MLTVAARRLYLYTADIPVSFLERLSKPSTQFYVEPVSLDYYQIPRSRLGGTLLGIARSNGRIQRY